MKITKNFTDEEMRCGCDRGDKCDAEKISLKAVLMLQAVRDDLRRPLHVTSARRCLYWNDKVGGSPGSRHPLGYAFDIAIADQKEGDAIQSAARRQGFNGIGRYKSHIHIDLREKFTYWDNR